MPIFKKLQKIILVTIACQALLISPAFAESGKLLFGLGPEADNAASKPLVKEAPVKMLSSWYNGSRDLEWMQYWKTSTIPQSYKDGYALHLIIFSDDAEKEITTPKGPACGRAYPLSAQYLDDMQKLAQLFQGSGPLYVTVFTEFQTYPCKDNQWKDSENYYQALIGQFTQTRKIFKSQNSNTKLSLGWGGWQARYDDTTNDGGRSLFKHFADVMNSSDFQSFQSMQSDHNIQDIRDMTKTLAPYGPVMLAHYKPDNNSQQTFDRDLEILFSEEYINEITNSGLFAMSFMDHDNINKTEQTFDLIKKSVTRYASKSIATPKKVVKRIVPTPTSTPIVTSSPVPTETPQAEVSLSPIPIPSDFSTNLFIPEDSDFFTKITKFFRDLF